MCIHWHFWMNFADGPTGNSTKKKKGDILDDGWDQFANLSTLSLGWSKITEKKKIKISSCTFIHLQLTPWCKKITENSQW
jgi:hypothetical protein